MKLDLTLYLVTDSMQFEEACFLNKIIGAIAKTVPQALKAMKEEADYLGVGAIYPTTTKVATIISEVSTLNEICKAISYPVVAIGGLNQVKSLLG